MSKKTSENKKKKYGSHPARARANKIRKIIKHLKRQPNDKQSTEVLEKL